MTGCSYLRNAGRSGRKCGGCFTAYANAAAEPAKTAAIRIAYLTECECLGDARYGCKNRSETEGGAPLGKDEGSADDTHRLKPEPRAENTAVELVGGKDVEWVGERDDFRCFGGRVRVENILNEESAHDAVAQLLIEDLDGVESPESEQTHLERPVAGDADCCGGGRNVGGHVAAAGCRQDCAPVLHALCQNIVGALGQG